MLEDGTVVARADGWLSAWVGDEYVMMSAHNGTCISLSETGGRIWELMEQPHSIADLCSTLESEYDAPPTSIHADVMDFLTRLKAEDALAITK